MRRRKAVKPGLALCVQCETQVPVYDMVDYSSPEEEGRRLLCSRCFNTVVAEEDGIEGFQHIDFKPVRLVDCGGQEHEFHFKPYLFGTGVALNAFELRDGHPGGYQFQVIGEPEEDLLVLLGKLIEKMRRALAIRHIVIGELGEQIAGHQTVRGRIGWDDDEEGQVPLLVIDGREFTWEEFGRMMMTFEGCHFKLEIRDKSEEV